MIYLDNSATTKPCPEAIAAMQAVLAREDAEEAKAAAKPVPAAS